MKISIITPSFNKPDYVLDAVRSVQAQTFTDFEYIVVDNSTQAEVKQLLLNSVHDTRIVLIGEQFTDEQRKSEYPTALILNKWLPKLTGDIIFYLSDDDYFKPNCFQRVVDEFTRNPGISVCYFGLEVVEGSIEKGWHETGIIKAENNLPVGTNMDCMLDGGQVVFRRECLEKIKEPYFRTEMDNETAHCDGMFLNKLSKIYEFYNIPDILAVKRRTNISTFIKY